MLSFQVAGMDFAGPLWMHFNFERTFQQHIQDACSQRNVSFHFIPPGSPHFGGLWKSSIKIAKQLIVKCTNGTALNYEGLTTAVTQVEAITNSRPFYALSCYANNFEALTPGHFLVGRTLNSLLEPCDEEMLKLPITNHWKRILAVQNSFWNRWSKEYLTLLNSVQSGLFAPRTSRLGHLP
ncbi:uncharacterized protein LOC123037664 [Drosophila rhopaloa]|uniref:DUF5641 domain-containing protein n=1 Tax=Drosophila rhopaloa TaxID=1041015 RepID=A0ABM5J8V6_DRORH|nr:uncharacterized protein LOC123037664 [Drosophila rhopaloa]